MTVRRKNRLTFLVLAVITLFSLEACKKTIGIPSDIGYSYFPIHIGDSLTYLEDSIIYDDFYSTIDTFPHEILDVTTSTFTDNSGRLSYLINRFIWDSTAQEWLPDISYYITPTTTSIEDEENNLRFIKLVFPVALNTSWQGNIYIDPDPADNLGYLQGWKYSYTAVNARDTVGNLYFDSTLTVVQQSDQLVQTPDYSSRLYSVEQYARNIGLIYKHFVYWQQQCVSYDQSGKCLLLGGKGGYEVIMQLTGHN
ncbi:MAG TPA: hypothetical protein VNE41_04180 [Chitinophagaceae bacterium]|nr:hypothetical protein [Chitinophagaceae bacterium]